MIRIEKDDIPECILETKECQSFLDDEDHIMVNEKFSFLPYLVPSEKGKFNVTLDNLAAITKIFDFMV